MLLSPGDLRYGSFPTRFWESVDLWSEEYEERILMNFSYFCYPMVILHYEIMTIWLYEKSCPHLVNSCPVCHLFSLLSLKLSYFMKKKCLSNLHSIGSYFWETFNSLWVVKLSHNDAIFKHGFGLKRSKDAKVGKSQGLLPCW